MNLENKLEEVHAYIDKWGEDLRKELNLPPQGATVGISFDPEIQLSRIPSHQSVAPGTYVSRDGGLQVEVVSQDELSGMVQVELFQMDDPSRRFDLMGANLFLMMFLPYAATDLNLGGNPHERRS